MSFKCDGCGKAVEGGLAIDSGQRLCAACSSELRSAPQRSRAWILGMIVRRRPWLIAASIVALLILINPPVWQSRWETKKLNWKVTDTYYLRSFWRPSLRFIHDGQDFSYGEITPSEKKHGKWKFVYKEPWAIDHVWYWYGDEVSEGRWHELNHE